MHGVVSKLNKNGQFDITRIIKIINHYNNKCKVIRETTNTNYNENRNEKTIKKACSKYTHWKIN